MLRLVRPAVFALLLLLLLGGLLPASAAVAHASPVASASRPVVVAPFECGALAACPSSPAPAPRVAENAPASGSFPVNQLVANWSSGGTVVVDPLNPQHLLAVGTYFAFAANRSWNLSYNPGSSGVFSSDDGGATWHASYLPGNATWVDGLSAHFHYNLGDPRVAFESGGLAAAVDEVAPGPSLGLMNSSDGGGTWANSTVIGGAPLFSSAPSLTVDPASGAVYLGYTTSNGTIQVARSVDGGATWIATRLAGNAGSGAISLLVDPYGYVDALWFTAPTGALSFARAPPGSLSFSAPVTVTPAIDASACGRGYSYASNSLCGEVRPSLAVDADARDGRTGALYVVWTNNSTATGHIPQVSLSRSLDNGSSWSPAALVDLNRSTYDLQPTVAVGPEGVVWVEWYGQASTYAYRLYAAASADGGRTFGPAFAVSDADSSPRLGASYNGELGLQPTPATTPTGVETIWTDMRELSKTSPVSCTWPTCPSDQVYVDSSLYTAELVSVRLSATVPATLVLAGTLPRTGTLPVGPAATEVGGLAGESYNVTAPSTVVVNGSAYYFTTWYGSNLTSGLSLNGTLRGPLSMTACYVPTPGAPCPEIGRLLLSVAPANASVAVDGVGVALSAGSAVLLLAPGLHEVEASATGDLSSWTNLSVAGGSTNWLNLTLRPVPGTLFGTVGPVGAAPTVTVNGTPLPVDSNGSFEASLTPGTYDVSVTAPAYAPFDDPSVTIVPLRTTSLSVTLRPAIGWVNGTVSVAWTSVRVDGVTVSVVGGQFATPVAPGEHWVNATATGYAPLATGPWYVGPGGSVSVALVLRPLFATLEGTVEPATASVSVDGVSVAATNGSFVEFVPVGVHWVNASASGYDEDSVVVTVSADTTSVVNLPLSPATGWVTGTVLPSFATVSIDGLWVPVSPSGAFNASEPAGVHTVVATAPGYLATVVAASVSAGVATDLALDLALGAGTTSRGPSGWASAADLVPLLAVGAAVAVVAVATVFRHRRRGPPPPPRAAGRDGSASMHR